VLGIAEVQAEPLVRGADARDTLCRTRLVTAFGARSVAPCPFGWPRRPPTTATSSLTWNRRPGWRRRCARYRRPFASFRRMSRPP